MSTTHCQIGSIVGCGISDKRNNVKWDLIKNIVFSWIITLPVCGIISTSLFSLDIYLLKKLNKNKNNALC